MDIYFQFDLLTSFKSIPNGAILKGNLNQNQNFDRTEIQKYFFRLILIIRFLIKIHYSNSQYFRYPS